MTSEAAQLAEALRAAKKYQGLSGPQIAEQIGRLTGSRPSPMWVTRRLHGEIGRGRPMLPEACPHCGRASYDLDPRLRAMARVLGVDIDKILAGDPPAVEVAADGNIAHAKGD